MLSSPLLQGNYRTPQITQNYIIKTVLDATPFFLVCSSVTISTLSSQGRISLATVWGTTDNDLFRGGGPVISNP